MSSFLAAVPMERKSSLHPQSPQWLENPGPRTCQPAVAHEATTLFTAGGMCRVTPGSRLILTNDRGAAQGARPYGHEPREQGPRGNRHDPRIVIDRVTGGGLVEIRSHSARYNQRLGDRDDAG